MSIPDLVYGKSVDYRILVVRPIPPSCSKNIIETLFQQHGAVSCDIMKRHSKLRGKVFVHFSDKNRASAAKTHFDGLFLFNRQLRAHFYFKKHPLYSLSSSDLKMSKTPPISTAILIKILNAIKSDPDIYSKVLRLFSENKINIFPTSVPKSFATNFPAEMIDKYKNKYENMLSSDESEIDSEPESNALSAWKKSSAKKQRIKAFRILNRSAFCFNRKSKLIEKKSETQLVPVAQSKCKISLRDHLLPTKEIISKFGYITEENIKSDPFLIKLFTLKNKSPASQRGNTIYVKNIAKDVIEEDFFNIVSSFFKLTSFNRLEFLATLKSNVKVNLMKKGRMRNQAFIEFQDKRVSRKAIKVLQKLVLKGKPLYTEYARNRIK